MKKTFIRKTALFAIIITINTISYAQLKIDSTGRVLAGTPTSATDTVVRMDPENAATMMLFGSDTSRFRAGAKLTFGDFGRRANNGWNVFVGEYENYDSDQLWLHGKKGFHLTVGTGFPLADFEYFHTHDTANHIENGVFNIYTDLKARSLATFTPVNKDNTSAIYDALGRIMQLEPINCTYSVNIEPSLNPDTEPNASSDPKTSADIAENSRLTAALSGEKFLYSFNLEQLTELFPTLVSTSPSGEKYVDYVSMVPVLVASIQEQQHVIENQNAMMEELRGQIDELRMEIKNISSRRDTMTKFQSFLEQNFPNPFTEQTSINYYVSPEAKTANLYVFNMTGDMKLFFNITQFGHGDIGIDGNILDAGMYVYTLVVDAQIADSKHMILTKGGN